MKVNNLVPRAYYSQSRDFSFIGNLFEIIINSAKTSSDAMRRSVMHELQLNTLGMIYRTETYVNKTSEAIISSFQSMIRNKGTIKAIKKLSKMLLQYDADVEIDETKNIQIILRDELSSENIVAFNDVLDYIIPCGCTYSIIVVKDELIGSNNVYYSDDNTKSINMNSSSLGQVSNNDNKDDDVNKDIPTNRSTVYSGVVVNKLNSNEGE